MQKHAYNSQVNTSVTTGEIPLPTVTMSGEGPDALKQALVPAFGENLVDKQSTFNESAKSSLLAG